MGMGYMPPYATANDVQSGFDQAAVISGINGITSAISKNPYLHSGADKCLIYVVEVSIA